nr:InlB B-repeat-containing protein [Lachnospiraceae bacterium]
KQQEQDEAAAEAKRIAEEEAKKAQEEKEKAAAAAEEARKKQELDYSLKAAGESGPISGFYLLCNVGEGDFEDFSIYNNGSEPVNLQYGISGASSDVFSLSMISGSTNLNPTDVSRFQIVLKPSAPVGSYQGKLYFKDARDDKNAHTIYLSVSADVKSKSAVSRVTIYPHNISLTKGTDYYFGAEVDGTDPSVSQAVNWSVTGAKSEDTYITDDGLLVISKKEKASSLSVIATSQADPRYNDRATVSVKSGTYNVTVSANPQNGGIVTGGGAVSRGSSVTLTAVANKNYYFEGWSRDGNIVSSATNYRIDDVESNISVTANFKQNFVTITAVSENDQAGSVVGGGQISYGGKTTLSAKAKDGYVFTGWQEGDSIISTSASLELNNLTFDRRITGKFAKTNYTITVGANPAAGGIVTGGGTYSLGSSATIEAKESPGYTFVSWNVNDQVVSRSPSYKIDRVDRDISFTAVFLQTGAVTYAISSGVATTGGTITPCGLTAVLRGQSVTYTITPKTGFAILAVAVDGVQVGPVSSYTFPNIVGNHAIAAAFVQTDAGAKAVLASGETPQSQKVQEIPKTEQNTATENNTVNLADAASGTAGDEFVEEMDLSDIPIPTDAELGIEDTSDIPIDSEVLRKLGITLDQAKEMIASGQSLELMAAAFYEGTLDFYVDNQYAPPSPLPDYHTLTREELEQTAKTDIYPSMPNLGSVTEKLLTYDELVEIAEGSMANVTVSITKQDTRTDDTNVKLMRQAVGQKPLQYFDLTMMKMVNGIPENVTRLEVPMEVIIAIPEDIYRAGKTYSVLRVHDGELSILPDLDDDPKTITFRTDRFSSYAIAEQLATTRELATRFAIGALAALVIALLCLVILLFHQIKVRKARRASKR